MARFDTSGLDELIRDMERMGKSSGKVAEAMVQAAVVEIQAAWKESADANGLRDTGAMIDSITYGKSPTNLGTALANDVYPQGKDGKGVRNAEKAFILNYGKNNFPATYWVDDADAAAEPRIMSTLLDMWGSFLESGKVPSVPAASGGAGGGISKRTK